MLTLICIVITLLAVAVAVTQRRKFLKEKKKYPWPIAFHTVDIALWRMRESKSVTSSEVLFEVCMGQKPDEVGTGLYRFPGGFVDPTDQSAEAAALRECREEIVGPEIDLYPKYITSMLTNDKRYRNSRDKILTSFYKIQYIYGVTRAGDDLAEVCWLPISEESLEKINPIHKKLFQTLIEHFQPKK